MESFRVPIFGKKNGKNMKIIFKKCAEKILNLTFRQKSFDKNDPKYTMKKVTAVVWTIKHFVEAGQSRKHFWHGWLFDLG